MLRRAGVVVQLRLRLCAQVARVGWSARHVRFSVLMSENRIALRRLNPSDGWLNLQQQTSLVLRFLLNPFSIERMIVSREAAASRQLILPVMQPTGQYPILDHGKARQIGFHMGAAFLDTVASRLPGALRGAISA